LACCAALVAAAAACRNRHTDDTAAAIGKMAEFSDKMCACLDKACADKVQEDMNRWASEQAKRGAPVARPSEADGKKMQEITVKYSECMTKVLTGNAGPATADSPAAAASVPLDVSSVLRQIRDRVAKQNRKLVMSKLEVSYARADGKLDAEYGKLAV